MGSLDIQSLFRFSDFKVFTSLAPHLRNPRLVVSPSWVSNGHLLVHRSEVLNAATLDSEKWVTVGVEDDDLKWHSFEVAPEHVSDSVVVDGVVSRVGEQSWSRTTFERQTDADRRFALLIPTERSRSGFAFVDTHYLDLMPAGPLAGPKTKPGSGWAELVGGPFGSGPNWIVMGGRFEVPAHTKGVPFPEVLDV